MLNAIEVRRISDPQDFLAQEKVWNTILCRSRENKPCLTHEWFWCWWKAFQRDNELHLLVATRNGQAVGIAPLMSCRGDFRGVPIQKICFMANGQSPSADFIIAEEDIKDVLGSLLGYLVNERANWDVLELQKIHARSATLPDLQEALTRRRLPFGLKESLKSPVISATSDWEGFLSSKPRKFRKVLRNKLNRIKRLGSISIERLTDEKEVQHRLKDIFLVSGKSWKHRMGTAITDSICSTTFYEEASRTMARKGWVQLWLMRDGNRPIAFEYHIKYRGTSYPIRADYDDDYRALSPGSVLEYHILKELFNDPTVKQYNSCGHTYQYLLNWTSELREHVTLQVFNGRVFPRFLYGIEYRAIPLLRRMGAKDFIKQAWKKVSSDGSNSS